MTLTCHCTAIRIEIRERPDFVHDCNCSLCSKAGARWGYFHPDEVAVAGATHGYRRTDKPEPAVTVHFCPECGCTTHFRLTPAAVAVHGDVQMGVNMRLSADEDMQGVEVRFPDGQRWSGAGGFGYVREPIILGD